MLETCREMKLINKYMKKCMRLVINKKSEYVFYVLNFGSYFR